MTDATVIEGEIVQPGEAGEKVGEPMPEFKDEQRRARELIRVDQGIAPVNLAQLVDAARDMAKARFSIPEHFHGNPGDCLAIIDIANRANLSPYMLAMETYVDPKTRKLAFMSRAYHALAQNHLIGDFDIEYEGEGEDLTCVVRGRTKKDPHKTREHRSPRLGDVRPDRNEKGIIKGSPLWSRKPKVQLAYDTVRDWVRLHCPQATLGVYTPDELEEYADEMEESRRAARESNSGSGVSERIANGNVDRNEGHRGTEHIEAELAQIAPASGGKEIKPAPVEQKPSPVEKAEQAIEQAVQQSEGAVKTDESKPKRKGKATEAKAETTVETAKGEAPTPANLPSHPQEPGPPPTEANAPTDLVAQCANAATWQDYIKLWNERLKLAENGVIADQWKRERAIREKLKMPSEEITEFRSKVDRRSVELGKKPANPLAAG